jgi:hypothetical protein
MQILIMHSIQFFVRFVLSFSTPRLSARFFHSNKTSSIKVLTAQHRPVHDIRGLNNAPRLLGKHRVDHTEQADLHNKTRGELDEVLSGFYELF